jgi:hypothetical protein
MEVPLNDQADDKQRRAAWDTFLAGVPSLWQPMAAALASSTGMVDGEHGIDGSWSITLSCGFGELRAILVAAPAPFDVLDSGQDWWLDQHLESEGGVLVAQGQHALVIWTDHFAAGLNVTLCVFSSEARFRAAVKEARSQHALTYDEDPDGLSADGDGLS